MTGAEATDTGALAVRGADAVAFLQGQLTQDVRRVADGGAPLAAYLSPQGRVLALMRLHALNDGVLLSLPRELVDPVAERLRRFVLRARVRLVDESAAWQFAGLLGDPPAALADAVAAAGMRLVPLGAANTVGDVRPPFGVPPRWLVCGPADVVRRVLGEHAADACAWRLAGVRAGEPSVAPVASGQWVPQMLNLDLLEGISFTKGCYTGQEIVARTQHLGRIKRRAFRYGLDGSRPLAPLAPLAANGEKVGEVIEAVAANGATELLAVVSLEARARPLLTVDGEACVPLPLPYAVP